jgi:hypothetical protein
MDKAYARLVLLVLQESCDQQIHDRQSYVGDDEDRVDSKVTDEQLARFNQQGGVIQNQRYRPARVLRESGLCLRAYSLREFRTADQTILFTRGLSMTSVTSLRLSQAPAN